MKQLIYLILAISLISSSASLTFAQHTLPASHGVQGETGSVNGTLATIPDAWADDVYYFPLTLHNSVVFWPGSPPSPFCQSIAAVASDEPYYRHASSASMCPGCG